MLACPDSQIYGTFAAPGDLFKLMDQHEEAQVVAWAYKGLKSPPSSAGILKAITK